LYRTQSTIPNRTIKPNKQQRQQDLLKKYGQKRQGPTTMYAMNCLLRTAHGSNPLAVLKRRLHLLPREIDHLQLHNAGRLAQYRLARGLRLNYPEAIALISMQMMEKIRDGDQSVAALMTLGQSMLGRRNVMPGVSSLIKDVQVEATFPDGTKLLTIHSPISSLDGNLDLALQGSFLPIPDTSIFGEEPTEPFKPGAVLVEGDDIEINKDRALIELSVTNTGDRPIQVGSHYAFVETNKALEFDRRVSIGKRLNVPSGASVRFEPGETKTVTLAEIGGNKFVLSGNRLTGGVASDDRADEIMARVEEQGFKHAPAAEVPEGKAYFIDRSSYADMVSGVLAVKKLIAARDVKTHISSMLLYSMAQRRVTESFWVTRR
jgi:urease beta subunit/urease gamma subunit